MQLTEHIWFLMSRNLAGEATEAENAELMMLLDQQPALQQQFDILKTWWSSQQMGVNNDAEPAKIGRILQRAAAEALASSTGKQGLLMRMKRSPAKAAIAAGLIVCIGTLTLWLALNVRKPVALHEVYAQNGSRTRTILPDGSTVWLNAGSRLTYKPGLTGTIREVTLEGEAYFDVMRRAGRAFIVHTKEIDIKVLGTAFNVKSYPNDRVVEATLIRGMVTITRNNKNAQPVLLRPHQKFVLSLQGKATAASNKVPPGKSSMHLKNNALQVIYLDSALDEKQQPETAWIYNRLEFRGDSFEELAKKLERWYNVKVNFEDEQVKQLTFNGSLENETVEQAFKALQAASNFKFTINENEIFIRSY